MLRRSADPGSRANPDSPVSTCSAPSVTLSSTDLMPGGTAFDPSINIGASPRQPQLTGPGEPRTTLQRPMCGGAMEKLCGTREDLRARRQHASGGAGLLLGDPEVAFGDDEGGAGDLD